MQITDTVFENLVDILILNISMPDTFTYKPIKIRRALILGNFYGQPVWITWLSKNGPKSVIDSVIGIRPDQILTRRGHAIDISQIKTINQLMQAESKAA